MKKLVIILAVVFFATSVFSSDMLSHIWKKNNQMYYKNSKIFQISIDSNVLYHIEKFYITETKHNGKCLYIKGLNHVYQECWNWDLFKESNSCELLVCIKKISVIRTRQFELGIGIEITTVARN